MCFIYKRWCADQGKHKKPYSSLSLKTIINHSTPELETTVKLETKVMKRNDVIDAPDHEDHDHQATTDLVRVRARRGQATDSHSLAERVRFKPKATVCS